MRYLNVFVLAALVSLAGCESREEARRKQVANNLKQIGLALQSYHAQYTGPGGGAELDTSDHAPITSTPGADDAERRAEKSTTVSGEVAEFHSSPDGEIDGVTLKDGTEVRFPRESGEKVTAVVSIGDQVEISGWTHAGESEVHAATITHVGSGQLVNVDQPPPGLPE